MSDTIDRLRGMLVTCGRHGTHGLVDESAVRDAIGEIERLERELFCVRNSQTAELAVAKDVIERLRAALTVYADEANWELEQEADILRYYWDHEVTLPTKIAREALK